MKRVVLIILLALALAPALSTAGPRAASDACSWQTNGQTVVIDGVTYVCVCERVKAIDEVWCALQRVSANRPAKAQKRISKPKTIIKIKARYGVGGGVIHHA